MSKVRYKLKCFLTDATFIILGILSAGFGLEGFLLPNSFIDGGVTGISLLLKEVTGISVSLYLILLNVPFIILAFFHIERTFAIKSIIAIVTLATVIHFIHYPVVTSDKVLIAAFGGFFLGLGIGLSIRGGAVLDGTEIVAIYLSRKFNMKISDFVLIFNVVIFGFGAYVLSIEIALYAILTYLTASKTIDFILEGIEEYTGITIISDHSEEIRTHIIHEMKRAVTIYKGVRGYSKENKEVSILYTVITRLEVSKFQREINQIDPNAFIVMNSVKDTKGGMIKKRPHM
ncbi:YitT family protein [Aureivirga sp. CE67]|uniref:YitT family protein n=1 Tax=Aureivirga sp. CE67 TaxID=1788983 RepID=UPI0018CA5E35|nr:YitT family protein [Aureivirga sp. CE67]